MTPLSSFWQAGYEGADHINPAGLALSMNDLNQHQARAAEDYAALAPFSIRTVRESAGWRLCERDGRYDFSTVAARMQAAGHSAELDNLPLRLARWRQPV